MRRAAVAKTELEDGGSWNVRTGPAVPQVVSDVLCTLPGFSILEWSLPAQPSYVPTEGVSVSLLFRARRKGVRRELNGLCTEPGKRSPISKAVPLPSWLWAVKAVAVWPQIRSPVLTPKPADFLLLWALPSQQRDSHDWPQPKDPGPECSWENEMSPNHEATGF